MSYSHKLDEWSRAIPDQLVNDLAGGRPPVFFLGAGLGKEALPPLPSGYDLEQAARSKMAIPTSNADLSQLLQFLRNREVSDRPVHQWLKEMLLHDGSAPAKPSGTHHLCAALPVQQYITTNYDLLTEEAAVQTFGRAAWLPVSRKEAYDNALRKRDFQRVCWHIHGSFHEEHLQDIVATTADYFEIYRNDDLRDYLKAICESQSVVFLGYSLRDFTTWTVFLAALSQKRKTMPPHVLVSPSDVGHEERFWSDYGIRYVPLKAFEFVIGLHCRLDSLKAEREWSWVISAIKKIPIELAAHELKSAMTAGSYANIQSAALSIV